MNEDWKKTIKVVPEFKLFRNYWLNNFESKKYIKETVNITVIDRKKNRIIKNIDELISLVDREKYEINIVQLELYTFEEQLNIIVNTDILLGFHGGGLAWLLFLPIGAKVIEILPIMTQFKDNRYYDVPYQFHNACKWCNISYFSAISDNETAAWDGLVNYLRPVDYKDEHNISTKDINKIMDFIKYK